MCWEAWHQLESWKTDEAVSAVALQPSSAVAPWSWALQGPSLPPPGSCVLGPALGLQQCPCSCRAHHRGHNTHISPGPLLLLDAARAGWASHRRCGKEIIKENQTHFEVSRWEQAELSACFYGAPCEAPAPSGCQHRPFPEGDFFPSLCREAAAPSLSPSHFTPTSHTPSSAAELCHSHVDGHLGAGHSRRQPQHRWQAGAMPWSIPLA